MWHVTPDKWHVTHDMWHGTCDMWHVTHRGWWTLSQNFRSLALTVLEKSHHVTCNTVTCDTWHMTHDMWHVTRDTQGVVNIVWKFQVPCYSVLWVMMFWRFGGKGWQSYLSNYKGFCRTAPATPGLLITGKAEPDTSPPSPPYDKIISNVIQIWSLWFNNKCFYNNTLIFSECRQQDTIHVQGTTRNQLNVTNGIHIDIIFI